MDSISESRLNEENNIAETVFRYQIQTSHKDRNCEIFFLTLKQCTDPCDEFMLRFLDNAKVKRYSQSVVQALRVLDEKTGERGTRLQVRAINWINDKEVEVSGSYFNGDVQIYTYYLQQENGHWEVKASLLKAIS
jgi:hypothetical protein